MKTTIEHCPAQAFLDWLVPRLPTARTTSGGRGNVGGILGNILRGD